MTGGAVDEKEVCLASTEAAALALEVRQCQTLVMQCYVTQCHATQSLALQ